VNGTAFTRPARGRPACVRERDPAAKALSPEVVKRVDEPWKKAGLR